jgi:hypothetical protein
MKTIMILACSVSVMLLAGCAGQNYNQIGENGQIISEPAGAESTNSPPETQARDINQQPYPGNDPYANPSYPFWPWQP